MGTWIYSLLDTIWLLICEGLYVFINWLYQVFESVARVNLFSREVFDEITGRIYVVVGIAMLFIFAYNLVLMIINPDDKKSTGGTGKIVKETMISFVLVILLPTIFDYAYIFQNHVLSTNIIGKVIMGGFGSDVTDVSKCKADDYECKCDFSIFTKLENYGTGEDGNIFADGFTEGTSDKDLKGNLQKKCESFRKLTDSQKGAYSIAPTIFSAYYRPAKYDMNDCKEYLKSGSSSKVKTDRQKQVCVNFFYDIHMSKYTANIDAFVNDDYLTLTRATYDNEIDFDWLWAILSGGLAVWMFLCYSLEIGVRVAKLGILQLISPIPVMMRIIPGQKEKIYDKWFNKLMETYLDVFIRLLIIYFALFAISLVPDVISTLFDSFYSGQSNWFIETLSLVIVILGILRFAQEAPELLKEFVGNSGKYALRSPGTQLRENTVAKGVVGGAGAMGAVVGKNVLNIPGGVANAYRDIKNAEGFKNTAKAIGKHTWRAVRNPFRDTSETVGAAVTGYKYGKEAKNWDDMRKYTYAAASEQMSKPTIGQKVGGFVSSEFDAARHYYTTKFETVDSKALLQTADNLDKVASALKKLEDKLDSSIQVKAANASVEAIKKAIQDKKDFSFDFDGRTFTQEDVKTAEGMRDVLENLEKYSKEQVGIARQRAYAEAKAKGDKGVLSLAEDYRSQIKENLGEINSELKKNGKAPITNVEVTLSDEKLSSDWKGSREFGKIAGDKASENRTIAIKQQEINSGKK